MKIDRFVIDCGLAQEAAPTTPEEAADDAYLAIALEARAEEFLAAGGRFDWVYFSSLSPESREAIVRAAAIIRKAHAEEIASAIMEALAASLQGAKNVMMDERIEKAVEAAAKKAAERMAGRYVS